MSYPFQRVADTMSRRKQLIARVREAADRTLLHAKSGAAGAAAGNAGAAGRAGADDDHHGDVSLIRPVSPADFVSPRLHSEILQLAHICSKNFALGAAAPQMGVAKRFIVINSGVFGPASPLTNLPYAHLTTAMNNAATPVAQLVDRYQPPSAYPVPPRALLAAAKAARAGTIATATVFAAASANASVTVPGGPSFVEYYAAYNPELTSPAQREAARYEYLLTDTVLNEYTVLLNPRITRVTGETVTDIEGCLSVPLWTRACPRPIAVDLEYDTFAFSPDVPGHEDLLAEAVTVEAMLHQAFPDAAATPAAAAALKAAVTELYTADTDGGAVCDEAAAKTAKTAKGGAGKRADDDALLLPAAVTSLLDKAVVGPVATSNAPEPPAEPASFDPPQPSPFAPAPALPHSPAFPPHASSLAVDARRLSAPYRAPLDPRWMKQQLPTVVLQGGFLAATAADGARFMPPKPKQQQQKQQQDDGDGVDSDEVLLPLRGQQRPLHAWLRLRSPTLAPQLVWYSGGAAAGAAAGTVAASELAPLWGQATALVPFQRGARGELFAQGSLAKGLGLTPAGAAADPAVAAAAAAAAASASAESKTAAAPAKSKGKAGGALPQFIPRPTPTTHTKAAMAAQATAAGGKKGKAKPLASGGLTAIVSKWEDKVLQHAEAAPGDRTASQLSGVINQTRFERYMARQVAEQQKLLEEESARQQTANNANSTASSGSADSGSEAKSAADDDDAAVLEVDTEKAIPVSALSPYAMGVRSAIDMITGDIATLPLAQTAYVPSPPLPQGMRVVRRKVTFRDLAARLVLHEMEHLDGKLFIDLAAAAVASPATAAGEAAAQSSWATTSAAAAVASKASQGVKVEISDAQAEDMLAGALAYHGNTAGMSSASTDSSAAAAPTASAAVEGNKAAPGEEEMVLSYPISTTGVYMPAATQDALRSMRVDIMTDLFHRGVALGPGHGGDDTDEVGAALPPELTRAVKKQQAVDEARARSGLA